MLKCRARLGSKSAQCSKFVRPINLRGARKLGLTKCDEDCLRLRAFEHFGKVSNRLGKNPSLVSEGEIIMVARKVVMRTHVLAARRMADGADGAGGGLLVSPQASGLVSDTQTGGSVEGAVQGHPQAAGSGANPQAGGLVGEARVSRCAVM